MKFSFLSLFICTVFFVAYSCNSSGLEKQIIKDDYQTEIFYIDSDSLRQGVSIALLSDGGDTIHVEKYIDGKLDGERLIFDQNGIVSTSQMFKKGEFHGPELTYYASGAIHTKGNYSNGILDSVFYVYYESGSLKEKVTMQDNVENGPFEEFYESGELHWSGSFIDGPNEVGALLEYNKTGEIIKRMECGKYEGEYICQTVWELGKGDVIAKLKYED